MALLVYIDETGSVGTGDARQPYLTLVAVIVNEEMVQPLNRGLRDLAFTHLGYIPAGFEFHGNELWGGKNYWSALTRPALIAAYEAAINLLATCDIKIAHSTIDKALLHQQYHGAADANAYRLALQFLLEKIDTNLGSANKIVIADETKEEQLHAIKMVADMQQWGGGEVPGRPLTTVIDSLHFVQSNASPGIQMADLVAYVIQRRRRGKEGHPAADAAMERMRTTVNDYTKTYRQSWPAADQ